MKKILFLLSVVLVTLTSCSSDNNDLSGLQEPVFAKEIAVTINGNTYTQKIAYDENKIQSITFQNGYKKNYTYTGNLITKIEDVDYNGKPYLVSEYTYLNGKIYSSLSSKYEFWNEYTGLTKFIHNQDGTVSYQNIKVDPLTGEEKEEYNAGKFFFNNGNIVKEEFYRNSVLQSTSLYEYDSENEVFKNILGYNLLLNLMPSVNNLVKSSTVIKEVNMGETIHTYSYNSNGYPVKKMVDVGDV